MWVEFSASYRNQADMGKAGVVQNQSKKVAVLFSSLKIESNEIDFLNMEVGTPRMILVVVRFTKI